MSRAKRIVRFSFWLNTITLVLLGGFMVVPLSSPWVPVLAGSCLVLLGGSGWYQRHRLGVHSARGFYWVDDERERAIAYRVHSAVLTSGTAFMYGLLVAAFFLTIFRLPAQLLGQTVFLLVWLGLLAANGQYYWLWHKYDQD